MTPCSPRALDLSVVIPAYNEANRLPLFLQRVLAYLDERHQSYICQGYVSVNKREMGEYFVRVRPDVSPPVAERSVCDQET